VQIVAGAHNLGDLGVVAHAEGGVAEVLLDSTDATVHVLVNNLVETAQERSTIEALGRYHTNDLVQLRDDSVGMIIRLSANTAHLLLPGAVLCCSIPLCMLLRAGLRVRCIFCVFCMFFSSVVLRAGCWCGAHVVDWIVRHLSHSANRSKR
jgi:hypothetical protein